MRLELQQILEEDYKLKAKQIAKLLGMERKEVNSYLHANPETFIQDDKYFWQLKNTNGLLIELRPEWMNSDSFEECLFDANLSTKSNHEKITFGIPKKCRILLEAIARLLALCNQLSLKGKQVTIKFDDPSAHSYLRRAGFFKLLEKSVVVRLSRSVEAIQTVIRGSNPALVELESIDPRNPNDEIPQKFKNSFVHFTEKKYALAAFTVVSELFGNVIEHSKTPTPGFAALQLYNGYKRNIQVVISDNGEGIIGTLGPVLKVEYPELAARFDISEPKDKAKLLQEILLRGQISKLGKSEGRGLGLKQSSEQAAKFNVNISIRQDTFEVILIYRNGILTNKINRIGRVFLKGTHVTFKFFLD